VHGGDGQTRTYYSLHPEAIYGPNFVDEHALAFANFMRSQIISFVRTVAGMRGLAANDLLQTGFEDLTSIMRETLPKSFDMFLPGTYGGNFEKSPFEPDKIKKYISNEEVQKIFKERIEPGILKIFANYVPASKENTPSIKGFVQTAEILWPIVIFETDESRIENIVQNLTKEIQDRFQVTKISEEIRSLFKNEAIDGKFTSSTELIYSSDYGKEVITDLSNLATVLRGFGDGTEILRVYRYLQTRKERYDYAMVKWLTLPMNIGQIYFKDTLKAAIENALAHVVRLRGLHDDGTLFAELLNSNQSNTFAQLVARYLDKFQYNRTVGDKRVKEGEAIEMDIASLAYRLRTEGTPLGERGLPALTPNSSNTLSVGEFNPI
jgi:hypothetical protein